MQSSEKRDIRDSIVTAAIVSVGVTLLGGWVIYEMAKSQTFSSLVPPVDKVGTTSPSTSNGHPEIVIYGNATNDTFN